MGPARHAAEPAGGPALRKRLSVRGDLPGQGRRRGSGAALRANFLSNRVFETYDEIIAAACEAWNRLAALPGTITSIGMRDWAHTGQS